MNCTIVTAYYELEFKKHSSSKYHNWSKLYLENIDANMIIFTDDKSLQHIQDFRKSFKDKTLFIIYPLESFYTYKFIDYWNKDWERDHEKRYHHPYLYMIWAEKSMFLQKAIEINKERFNSDFYCWTDIGMVREERTLQYISKFPNKKILEKTKKDKIYLLNVENFLEKELEYNDVTEIFRYNINRIGGGFILGHKDILPKWISEYYDMLNKFMYHDYFAGKDQSIMICVYLKNKDNLIELIKPIYSPIDKWFYMLYYFGNILE